jgi:hypothetical protein
VPEDKTAFIVSDYFVTLLRSANFVIAQFQGEIKSVVLLSLFLCGEGCVHSFYSLALEKKIRTPAEQCMATTINRIGSIRDAIFSILLNE